MSTVIFGWYGHNNFGDELILASLLHQIGREGTVVFSDNPEHTRRTHNVQAVKWRSGDHRLCWPTILRCFAAAERVIVGGGGLWNDNHPRNILYYAGLPLIAALMGCQVHAIGMGVDAPIKRKVSKILLRLAGCFFEHIEVRDRNSQRFLRDIGVDANLGCDLAREYPYPRARNGTAWPWIIWALSPKAPLAYVKEYLATQPILDDHHVFVSCFDCEDLPVIHSVTNNHQIISNAGFEEILEALRHADLIISSRLHPLIVAHELGIPSIALCDEPKFVNVCH